MTFPTPDQKKQMLNDVEKVEASLVHPVLSMYGSVVVPWVADLCCHVKALLAEIESLRSDIDAAACEDHPQRTQTVSDGERNTEGR